MKKLHLFVICGSKKNHPFKNKSEKLLNNLNGFTGNVFLLVSVSFAF